MAKAYSLRLILRGIQEPLVIATTEKECERLRAILSDLPSTSSFRDFFCFSSLDGNVFSINLGYLQSVNFLWDVEPYAPDRTDSEDSILIWLNGQSKPVETYSDQPEQIYDFFYYSETDDGLAFRGFLDIDGEYLTFNVNEIIYFQAPEDMYLDGERISNEE